MLRWLRRLHRAGQPEFVLDDATWRETATRIALIRALDEPRRTRLRTFTQQFLRRKDITGAAGFEPDRGQTVTIAALACLPVLERGMDWLVGWHQIIVYPGQFGVRRHHRDEDTGVVSEWDDELAGEAWEHGPVIVSWTDIASDLEEPQAGFQVIAHEIAHKLDALDGTLDGAPPMPKGMSARTWAREFQAAYDALCAEVDAGLEPAIDPYAAEAPEEFFAVVTEYHFSAPDLLEETMPAVAAQLRAFYGPSPFA